MKHYRVPFMVELGKALAAHGISLTVVYGTPWRGEAERGDHAALPEPLGKKVNSSMWFGKLLLMPVFTPWWRADLVVVEHANKNLLNYLLALLHALGWQRVAFWSHGRDRQASGNGLGERFKRRSLHWADWWFAYTGPSAAYVAAQGFPARCITVVENAIDTRSLRGELAAVSAADLQDQRAAFGWRGDEQVALFCGSLYQNKRLDLLFDAADMVWRVQPAFRLLIVGGGPLAGDVTEYARTRPWVKALGPMFGRERSVLMRLACLWLNPGALGLGILDAFCAGLPLLTTQQSTHGPEIDYLEPGRNGLLLDDNAGAYADGMLRLLRDPVLTAALRNGALASARRYSIETMVGNFSKGVRACLSRS